MTGSPRSRRRSETEARPGAKTLAPIRIRVGFRRRARSAWASGCDLEKETGKSGGLGDLNYPLISDVTKSISKSYGVLIPDQGVALRGLFIIDKEGVIQHSTINNLAIGRSVDETMRTLQALQFVQENPDEVCPAGWKPGEKSMKPDPKLSKEYFAAI
ncbi:uncharacterized protein A4U43_C10F16870 [Asparagus officinalis]|uniref:thioredoxin-dependent peroxiredoxin n=1 Tax=Asparagus officinalis TaxID=4686 RepID=A0A5P1E6Q1_ASPOF|nr:uncharacterized protein A4U43_C10F16870 [Asparagus officinalis]